MAIEDGEQLGDRLVVHELAGRGAYDEERSRLSFALMTARAEWVYRGNGGRTTSIEVAGRMMLNDGAALLEAAIAGAGLARLPSFVAHDALASVTPARTRTGCSRW